MKKLNIKWNNVIKFTMVVAIVSSMMFIVYKIGGMPEKVEAEVDITDFRDDNDTLYSMMVVKTVPSFETKGTKSLKYVIIADFNAFYKGSREHIVDCNGKASCNSPEGRNLTPIAELDKEERDYYLSFFN